ncbi:MAG: ACT domain-containing protein, partial [Candidatus Hydrogenedentales bacterium]
MADDVVLLFQCPDRRGIVASLTELVFRHGGNITQSDQYSSDPEGGRFYMRLEFRLDDAPERDALKRDVEALAGQLGATWQLHFKTDRPRMAIAVSRYDHCLVDLLYRAGKGELRATIPCVVSNHDTMRELVERHRVPYYHLPVTADNKTAQEQQLLEIVRDTSDFLVLARYMQI